ncbi:restriction endonuclease subunit S [Vibrio ouci]|uniref:Restriction endonuclease subunit S n=1 Tax=Vibrio ouci TaxID=2499078 RepID=A0A4Y8WAL6_9VIBR|nr:restriction endonuclease subunit S [Vibrio ouci]TFH89980.1 restriction endonuclease subunit S [Vibrio ouci]
MSNVVPEGWAVTSIGELTKKDSLFSDGDWVESKDQDPNGSNRLIQLADIGDGRFINKSSRYLNDEQFERLNCTTLRKNDVLVARMPEPLGRACLYPLDNARAATIVDIAIIRTPNADHKWLMSAINSSDYRADIELNASGTTRTRIARGALSKLKLIAPPLPEQKKIAAILTSADDVIEKIQAQIDKLKDLKTGMMQELLTRGVGVDGKPHAEFKDSPVGRIPKGWEVRKISELCTYVVDCVNKTAPVVDYKTPYKMIRTTNVRHGRVDTENVRYVTEETYNAWTRRLTPENGDLIFTREAPVGECGVLEDSRGVFLGQRTMMYRADQTKTSSHFLLYSLMSEYGKQQLEDFSGGSTVPHMRVPDCSKILIKLPPKEEQGLIVNSLKSVDVAIKNKEKKLQKVSHMKKALMQDLLTGKVRVKVED